MKNYPQILIITFIAIFSLGFTGCSKNKQAPDIRQTKVFQDMEQAKSEGKNALLFFINPNGRPCQQQQAILEEIKESVKTKVNYVFINSLDPANNAFYYQFGVRSLPNLIILDKTSKVHVRFSPGIIEKDALLEQINKL